MKKLKNLSDLIELWNDVDFQEPDLTDDEAARSACELVDAFRNGIAAEIEKLPELFSAYQSRIERDYRSVPVSSERLKSVAIADIAFLAASADHDLVVGKLLQYYENPKLYGLAMKAVADYIGLEGGC